MRGLPPKGSAPGDSLISETGSLWVRRAAGITSRFRDVAQGTVRNVGAWRERTTGSLQSKSFDRWRFFAFAPGLNFGFGLGRLLLFAFSCVFVSHAHSLQRMAGVLENSCVPEDPPFSILRTARNRCAGQRLYDIGGIPHLTQRARQIWGTRHLFYRKAGWS